MWYKLYPPKRFVGRSLKTWYRRLHNGTIPANWRERPPLYARPEWMSLIMKTLHQGYGSWPVLKLDLKTYRP